MLYSISNYIYSQVIQVRKQEIEQHGRCGPAKTSERIRSKRTSRVGPVHTSRALAIMEPPGSEVEPDVKVILTPNYIIIILIFT